MGINHTHRGIVQINEGYGFMVFLNSHTWTNNSEVSILQLQLSIQSKIRPWYFLEYIACSKLLTVITQA